MSTRGTAISAYSPAFAKGAKVYGANIASGEVTSAHIATGTVVAGDIGDGSITSAKIATGAVTSVKLGAASVISAKIGTGAVLAANLGAGAVTSAKLGTKAVKLSKMFAAHITGTIISSGITYSVAHGLSAVPSLVLVTVRSTKAHISALATVGETTASARTSAVFYVVGQPHGVKFAAYVQV